MPRFTLTTYHRLGLIAAVVVLVVDLATKAYFYSFLFNPPTRIVVTDFFNLTAVWNYGVSFGLMRAEAEWQWLKLLAITVAITGVVAYWLWTATDRATALACGLVLGGALGNIYDRATFGAVRDFFDFHLFGYHWPAFNVADAAIVCGVIILLYLALIESRHQRPTP